MPKQAKALGYMQNQQGFSLIELSIILVIMGILIVPVVQAYNLYKKDQDRSETLDGLQDVATALGQYYISNNGIYPCPADPTLPTGNANHGVAAAPVGNCNASGNLPSFPAADFDGDGNAEDWDQTGAANDLLVMGAVPYETLQIPQSATFDSYGNKIMYAVTLSMTTPGADNRGGIQVNTYVRPEVGPDYADPTVKVTGSNDIVAPFGLPDNGAHHYVVFSTGANGLGGYTKNGAAIGGCAADGNDIGDDENCDRDGTFLFDFASDIPGASYYDDLLLYRAWAYGSLWALDGEDIYNKNYGNVGVGTDTPLEKLHVNGNLKTDKLYTLEVCDDTGGCFSPRNIGGDIDPDGDGDYSDATGGMECESDGEVLVGISGGNKICEDIKIDVKLNQVCDPGEFVQGFDSDGNVICDVP